MPKPQVLKIYGVEARIVSGITAENMWEGMFEIPATSLKAARKLTTDLLHDSTYYDPRIDPKAVIDSIDHIGEVEVLPAETSEQVAKVLIDKARSKL